VGVNLPPLTHLSSKSDWRTSLRSVQCPRSENSGDIIIEHLIKFLKTTRGTFLFYRAFGNEITLDPLADALGWSNFAVTRTPEVGSLTVHLATEKTEIHRFGFLQPKENSRTIGLDKINVSLIPGIAFDEFGNRLGHGSGYYDQLLPKLNPSCLMIGVTTENLIFEQLPSESHDIPMTHLVTELGIRQTKNY
tara:strand:- start:934 stop:1509 length:576 start_codon:yes stop_codon:yes gene_type:complete